MSQTLEGHDEPSILQSAIEDRDNEQRQLTTVNPQARRGKGKGSNNAGRRAAAESRPSKAKFKMISHAAICAYGLLTLS